MREGRLLRRRSLRTRIVVAATVAVAVVLVAGGWLLSAALRQALVEEVGRSAVLRSADLAALAADGALPRPIPAGEDDEALAEVVVDGRVVASSRSDAAGGGPTIELDPPAAGRTRVTELASIPALDDDERFLVATTGVTTPSGDAIIHVASSLEDVDETITEAVALGLQALPVLVAVLGVGIWLLVGRTLAPVEAIRAEADAIGGSDLHRRVPEPGRDDEIGRLAGTLNRMLGRLERSSERQRRFVADAAHELRTPVASLRTTLETARSSPREIDWDEVSGDALADTIRMQQLTEQLLVLARIESGRRPLAMQTVDLDDVVVAALARREAVAGVHVETGPLAPVQVTGEPILLGQAVGNLVDNAVVHASSRVVVGLEVGGDAAVVTVDDDGPGIPPDQREAVFEPFTRLDQARTRDRAGGAGLGLAIVADIVTAHGGTVEATDSPLGGARLVVRLPRRASAVAAAPSRTR